MDGKNCYNDAVASIVRRLLLTTVPSYAFFPFFSSVSALFHIERHFILRHAVNGFHVCTIFVVNTLAIWWLEQPHKIGCGCNFHCNAIVIRTRKIEVKILKIIYYFQKTMPMIRYFFVEYTFKSVRWTLRC